MKLKKIFIFIFLFLIIFSYAYASEPLKPLNTPEKEFSLPSKIRLSTQLSTEDRYSFYIDYLLPLYYSKDKTTLLFFNPKQTLHMPSAKELNLGLGLRKAFKDEYILGIHFFYDKKYSPNKVWHYQRGYGFEYLSEPLDIRFNYYDPVNKPKRADHGYGFGESNLLYWESFEEPLEGFDFEVGFPLAPKRLNTRLYLGGYLYDSKLSHDQEGLRLRTETKLKRWLSLDTSLNIDDQGETNFIGGLRVTIPFELTHLNQTKDTFVSTTQDLSYIQQRLFERVVRDIDIQSSSSRASQPTTSTTPAGATIDNIIYVDNTNSGTEDGSLSHPYNTLTEAIDDASANDTIFVFKGNGSSTGLTGGFTLPDDVILWGSGYNNNLRNLPVTGYPLLDGDNSVSIITLGSNNTIMGCQIHQGSSSGIRKVGVAPGTLNINHNLFTNNLVPIQFYLTSGTANITVSDNTFTNNSMQNVKVEIKGADATTTISGNTITGGYSGVHLRGLTAGKTHTAYIFNNTISSAGYGMDITSTAGNFNVSVYRNTVTNNSYGNIFISCNSNPIANVDLGGGTLGSIGYNSFSGSADDVYVNETYHGTLMAENNWWGESPPDADQIDSKVDDYEPYLTSDPN